MDEGPATAGPFGSQPRDTFETDFDEHHDMNSPEQLAASFFKSDVKCDATLQLGSFMVSFWMTSIPFPPLRIAVLESDSEAYVISRDTSSLQRFLKDCKPAMNDADAVAELLDQLLPIGWRILNDRDAEYIKSGTGHRPAPCNDGDAYTFYCNDFTCGKVVRCRIGRDFNMSHEVVGKGIEMDIL